MIHIKEYNGNTKGKRIIENLIPWQDNNIGHKLSDEEKDTIRTFKHNKMKDKSIQITCDDNSYIIIPNFNKTFYTVSSDDNYTKGELTITTKDINEIYIPIKDYEIDFKKNSSMFRPFIIDEITNNENVIKRYLVILSIQYKNNGKINNENFDFDYTVRINKVFEKNITYGLIDYAFYGYLLWIIINLLLKKDFLYLLNNPTSIIVIITYLISIIVKTRFIGNTIINKIPFFLRIKKKYYYTNNDLKKLFKKYKKNMI